MLKDDGTVWLNLGDSYNNAESNRTGQHGYKDGRQNRDKRFSAGGVPGLRPKNLILIPFRVALALQADGWIVRSDIIWHKTNAMPESVTDRPTKAHEYVFLLSKSERYYYDADAIKEQASLRPVDSWEKRKSAGAGSGTLDKGHNSSITKGEGFSHTVGNGITRNKRSVWSIPTASFSGAHFATFPPKLAETCIKAGCPNGGIVLDPFNGSGTTGLVAQQLGRRYVGIDLSFVYLLMARERIGITALDEWQNGGARIDSENHADLPLFGGD